MTKETKKWSMEEKIEILISVFRRANKHYEQMIHRDETKEVESLLKQIEK